MQASLLKKHTNQSNHLSNWFIIDQIPFNSPQFQSTSVQLGVSPSCRSRSPHHRKNHRIWSSRSSVHFSYFNRHFTITFAMDDDLLIAAVWEREVLWNPSHDSHKNVNILKAAWVEVAQIVNKPVKIVKSRWKNVRAYFYNIQEKQDSMVQEGSSPPLITWQLYNQMSFLKDINVVPSRASASFQEIDISLFSDPDQSSLQDPLALGDSPQTIDSSSNAETPQPKRDKENNIDSHSSELLALKRRKIELLEKAESQKAKSDDLLFFESLLPYMAQIPPIAKLKLRNSIQDLILQQIQIKSESGDS
uniref:Transcription factor Adf-1 n=1 Tax=Lygus hesperus TaxID=30085 RepID=A0A0A9XLD3_LYGHE